jgi:hypothetical protein
MQAERERAVPRWVPWLPGAIAVSFLAVYVATAGVGATPPFSSPDETANHFFATRVLQTGEPTAPADPDAALVRPRGIGIRGNALVPNTFLGLPLLYGGFGRVAGEAAMGYLAPVLAVVAALCFERWVRALFGPVASVVALVIVLTHPTYWYYGTHGFWHNGPFVSFLLIAGFLLYRARHGKALPALGAGISIGLALAMRASEFLWVGGGLLLAAVGFRQTLRKGHAWFLVGAALVLVPLLFYQWRVYGSALTGAYAPVLGDAGSDEALGWLGRIAAVVAPTGWDFGRSARVLSLYALVPMVGSFTLGLVAAIRLLRVAARRAVRWYAAAFIALTVWLALYYGSFAFVEFRLDPGAILLGSSHFRYFLPVYVAAVPLAAWLLTHRWASRKGRVLAAALVAAIAAGSLLRFATDPYTGYAVQTRDRREEANRIQTVVFRATPADAVIVAGPLDKVLWPSRRVIGFDLQPVPDAVVRGIPELASRSDTFLIPAVARDAERVSAALAQSGFALALVEDIDASRTLFRVVRRTGEDDGG